MSVNKTIKAGREALGLSVSEFARRCGVSRAAVQQWEKEDGFAPTRAHQPKVAQVLKMSVGEMMGTAHDRQAPDAALSPRALQVARMFDSITDLRQRQIAYAYMVAQSGWTEKATPDEVAEQLTIEAEALLPRPRHTPSRSR